MRVLVTGCGGFVGPWLTKELVAHGHSVSGASLDPYANELLAGGVASSGNLRDVEFVRGVLAASRPESIIHLAALSHVGESWNDPARYFDENSAAAARLFSEASRAGVRRFVFVSSCEVYGVVQPEELPLTERSEEKPANPYAVSKLSSEKMLKVLSVTSATELVIARPFTHTGPGQTTRFACPSFADQVLRVASGQQPRILHGDLTPRRDFLDVRDMVRAYRMLVECPAVAGKTINIASGRAVAVGDILEAIMRIVGVPSSAAVLDPSRLRPVDLPELRGDSSLMKALTGWQPRFDLETTLRDIVAHERGRQSGDLVPGTVKYDIATPAPAKASR